MALSLEERTFALAQLDYLLQGAAGQPVAVAAALPAPLDADLDRLISDLTAAIHEGLGTPHLSAHGVAFEPVGDAIVRASVTIVSDDPSKVTAAAVAPGLGQIDEIAVPLRSYIAEGSGSTATPLPARSRVELRPVALTAATTQPAPSSPHQLTADEKWIAWSWTAGLVFLAVVFILWVVNGMSG